MPRSRKTLQYRRSGFQLHVPIEVGRYLGSLADLLQPIQTVGCCTPVVCLTTRGCRPAPEALAALAWRQPTGSPALSRRVVTTR